MAKIFLSYAHANRPAVEALAHELRADDHDIWWDKQIHGGAEFAKRIERHLHASDIVVVAWSKEASDSRWVRDEAGIAAQSGKLITLTLDGSEPPIGFKQFHAIDFSGSRKAALTDLRASINAKLSGEETEDDGNWAPVVKRSRLAGTPPIAILAALVALAAVTIALVWQGSFSGDEAVMSDEKSLAVLPFEMHSTDSADAFIGLGIAEGLLDSLAEFPDLKVSARTSAFSLAEEGLPVDVIAQRLGVEHVVQGTVRRLGDRIRVSAQLIRASDGVQLWSETFDRTQSNLFAIEDEIVGALSLNLQTRLGVGAGAGRASARAVNAEAYSHYLEGLALWSDRDRDGNRAAALEKFQLATRIDPNFADAWSAIGAAGTRSSPYLLGVSSDVFVRQTEEAFAKALELDPENGRAHAGLAAWHAQYDIDVDKARFHIKRALEIAPNSAAANYSAAHLLDMHGDTEGSLRAYDRAISLDPLNMTIQRSRARLLAASGRYDEVETFFEQCDARDCINKRFMYSLWLNAAMHSGKRDEIERRLAASEAEEFPDNPFWRVIVAAARLHLGLSGKEDIAAILATPPGGNEMDVGLLPMVAIINAQLGETQAAIDALQRSYEARQLFSQPINRNLFYGGAYQLPEAFMRSEAYRRFWSQPELRKLAAVRRANGQANGLPLE